MSKFEKVVTALLVVLAAELGAVCVMAVRMMNGVQIEVIQNDESND